MNETLLEKEMTFNQFANLLMFKIITEHEDKYSDTIGHSPSYIIEKYEKYIGDPKGIQDNNNWRHGGIHIILREEILNQYFRIWFGEKWERIYKINDVINQ